MSPTGLPVQVVKATFQLMSCWLPSKTCICLEISDANFSMCSSSCFFPRFAKGIPLVTSLLLKKAPSSIGADGVSRGMRPLVYRPCPLDATPLLAINQVRTKVKPPPGKAPPPLTCMPPPLLALVYGDGGSEVHCPLGPNRWLDYSQVRARNMSSSSGSPGRLDPPLDYLFCTFSRETPHKVPWITSTTWASSR